MKIIDIALKDMTQSFRTAVALVFMFGLPLMVTGLFYVMFGNIAQGGEFDLPVTKVIVANLDRGSPALNLGALDAPGGIEAETMGELVVKALQSDELRDLIQVSQAPQAETARAAVDNQEAQVALIIPQDFSAQFALPGGQAVIEFYQDPTLTIGPGIVQSILNQFTDGLAGARIAVELALQEAGSSDIALIAQVIQLYSAASPVHAGDAASQALVVQTPDAAPAVANPMLQIVGPIMGGMMIFFAFYTGTATAQSILREEEQRTLPRLFTTPTRQAAILSGKFLAVFLTVLVQVSVLLVVTRLVFRIQWGELASVALVALGIVATSSSTGIFIVSLLKGTKQGGMVFGGVLTLSGILGMIGVFAGGSPTSQQLTDSVSLLVPQGWAVRALSQSMDGGPLSTVLQTALIMLAWSAAFFAIGVWRFNRRYA